MATHNQIQAEANKLNAKAQAAATAQRRQQANAAQRETNRSNRAKESLTRRGQNINAVMSGLNTIGGALSTGAKLIGSANDPSWYNKDPQLVKDVAQVSFNTPIRSKFELGSTCYGGANAIQAMGAVPLGAQIAFVPTIGFSAGESSVANVAAKNIYAYVRFANSGASNYEATDLMIYLLAMDSLYSAYAWGLRTYSILTHADRYNGYTPVELAKLAGCQVVEGASSDWFSQIANVRAYLNMLRVRIQAFNVPSNFPYFNRHIWMNMNIFKDMDIHRSSLYVMVPNKLYVYTGDTIKYLGSFDFITGIGTATTGITFSQYQQVCNLMVNSLIADEDIGIISGDILKAYGVENMFKLDPVPEEFDVGLTYSEEVLSQIASATIVPITANTCNIGQTASGLLTVGTIGSDGRIEQSGFKVDMATMMDNVTNRYVGNLGGLINVLKDDVTPDDIMVATRLMCNYAGTSFNDVIITECGSEIVQNVGVLYRDPYQDTDPIESFVVYGNDYIVSTVDVIGFTNVLNRLSVLAKLDWVPNVTTWIGVTDSTAALAHTSRDYGNVAYVNENQLANMHYVAMLSMFAVPDIGTRTR